MPIAPSRRSFLKALAGPLVAAAWPGNAHAVWQEPFAGEPGLAARAATKGLIFGAAEVAHALANDPLLVEAYRRECSLLVAANELKWWALRREPHKLDFAAGDWLFLFAKQNHLAFRGHTLVWHYDVPSWAKEIAPGAPARHMLEEHIWSVAGRYRGHMQSWDVVNEPLHPADDRADGLRRSYWLQAIGPDYLDVAFRTARAADPNALLVLNEYGVEFEGGDNPRKRKDLLRLIDGFRARNVPIDAIGIQAHLSGAPDWFDAKVFLAFLDELAARDLRVLITELDVRDDDLPRSVDRRDRIVADRMTEFLETALSHPAVGAVITWGLSDRYTWMSEFHPRSDGFPSRPLPLDSAMGRKPAWAAIARAIDGAPVRTPLPRAPAASLRSPA